MTASERPRIALYSPASRGGAGWFVFALAQAMGQAGADLLFIAPPAEPAEREPSSANVRRHVLVRGRGGRGPLIERIARTAWRIASTFPALLRARMHAREIVVTLYDWIPVLVAQMLWVRLIGGRLTFIVHDATPHAWQLPARLRPVERALFRLSYALPHRIVSLTHALDAELADAWGRRDRRWVIPHGAFVGAAPTGLPGNGIVLLFGMLRRNKRIAEAIEAMRLVAADLPELRLVIAGAPHAEDPAYWLECEAALRGIEDRVHTEIGFVAEPRVAELLAASDAVLLPYADFNSQSGVAVLAAFAERVLIATPVGGIAELAGLGLEPVPVAEPVTAAGIADALRAFAAMPVDARRRMARASRAALTDALDWERIGRAYVALIAER